MGITGLIPFLKDASRPVNVREYAGSTVAIDAYCWLHKGAIGCAEKLVMGEHSEVYVNYCVKYLQLLMSHKIKPVLVFDGRHLPAKAETEKSRRVRRDNNKKRLAELKRQDRHVEAKNVVKACVDITPEMAFALVRRCRQMGVDCIVAPFEADAQLAYLNISGMADLVITEDSDLLLFGCSRVLFKLDLVGNGLLIEQSKLALAMKVHPDQFSMDKFRHMCILSGCDYLASLPGVGLTKACKFIKRSAETNISRALLKMGAHLNMSNLVVEPEYCRKFLEADFMFKHQPVFDPKSRRVVPMTPIPDETTGPQLETFPEEISYQLALGNLNPFTLQPFESRPWDPDSGSLTTGWNKGKLSSDSIWSKSSAEPSASREPTRAALPQKIPASLTNSRSRPIPKKHPEEEVDDFRSLFATQSPPRKRFCSQEASQSPIVECSDDDDEGLSSMNQTSVEDDILDNLDFDCGEDEVDLDELLSKSPVLEGNKFLTNQRRNKFSCPKESERGRLSQPNEAANIVASRYFSIPGNTASQNLSEPKKGLEMSEESFHSELDRIADCSSSGERRDIAETQGMEEFTLDLDEPIPDERPSFLARLDQISRVRSEGCPPLKTAEGKSTTSSFNWKPRKPAAQKSVSSYLGAQSSTPARKPPINKSRATKSTSKPANSAKSKPLESTKKNCILERFGFKPKPKMTL